MWREAQLRLTIRECEVQGLLLLKRAEPDIRVPIDRPANEVSGSSQRPVGTIRVGCSPIAPSSLRDLADALPLLPYLIPSCRMLTNNGVLADRDGSDVSVGSTPPYNCVYIQITKDNSTT